MKYRVFDDYFGQRWEVWQTNPADSERRSAERRILPDRRKARRADSPERRGENSKRTKDWARFPGIPQLEGGWLCFEREGQRRRLAPVPEAWETADDMTLAALCNFASEDIKGW